MEIKEFNNRTEVKKKNNFKDDFLEVQKRIWRRRVGIIIALVSVVAVIAITMIINANKFNVWDYITVEYEGADGYAKPTFAVDSQRLYKALIGKKSDSEKEYNAKMLIASIEIYTDAADLKNGDKYKVTLEIDKKYEDAVGISVGSGKKTLKASGIDKGIEVELFDKVDVMFAGISPEAYVVATNNWEDEYLKSLTFTVDKTESVGHGDTINVTCDQTYEEIARHGYLASELEMEFVADKLPSYLTDASQIDKEVLTEVKKEALATMVSETADATTHMLYKASQDASVLYHLNNESCTGGKILGTYYLQKKGKDGEYNNYIYIMACGLVSDPEDSRMVYFLFEYTNNYVNVDGTFDMIHDNPAKRYTCSTDYDGLYNSKVAEKAGNYTITEIK